ncbi:FimV/HubP family polar landmark protein [Paludibacterium denitrificans]|uniref:FimV/HubP family polar landmark protein n=1 Tax=Paludibacterium denitrificans TaxID=2675226 RepID=UPI001E649434|nr:FimV/HubP family polar landmark protein [Paludibacterium denitrificans]
MLAVAMVCSAHVWAGLGKISVKSHLGDPFRADILLSGVRGADLDGARVGLADINTFRDLNVDYSGILSSLRFSLVRGANGAAIRVSSSAPINEPYLRFVVEARTSAGRSVREYTVLLDPADYSSGSSGRGIVQDLPRYADDNLSRQYRRPVARANHRIELPGTMRTTPGMTLRSLASQVKPGVSLNQTMAAIVQANPQAFIDGNPDRMRAGVAIKVPSAGKIKTLANNRPAGTLSQARSSTAETAQLPAVVSPEAKAGSRKGGDVLKLVPAETGGAADSKLSDLQRQVAMREQSLKDAEARISALEEKLKALQTGKPMAEAASAPAALNVPVQAASTPAVHKPAATPLTTRKNKLLLQLLRLSVPWLDALLDNLPLIGGGVGAVGLLAALGIMVTLCRKSAGDGLNLPTQGAGAVLGRDAITNIHSGQASAVGGHSFMSNFTQASGAIDAAEVDPVAEAEVYMAYGRDARAEEILKDALNKDPARHEVRLKLMEIYAARPDVASFEKLAKELHVATDGRGALWAKAAALGLGLDPANPLYQTSSEAGSAEQAATAAPAIDLDQELFGALDAAAEVPAEAPAEPRLEDMVGATTPASDAADENDPLRAALLETPTSPEVSTEPEPVAQNDNMLDFDIESLLAPAAESTVAPAEPVEEKPEPAADNLLDFDFNLESLNQAAAAVQPADTEVGILEAPPESADTAATGFESLYQEAATPPASAATPSHEGMTVLDDPLSTKLDLAKVYLDMGDRDGAREVLEDLVSEAQGALKDEAQTLLTKIST